MDDKPGWEPNAEIIKQANITQFMLSLGISDVKRFHAWTVSHFQDFWQKIIARLNIHFKIPPVKICDLSLGVEQPKWLSGAKMNITDSCFNAPGNQTAILYEDINQQIVKVSYRELDQLSNQVANSLVAYGCKSGDAIAILMPMHIYAVAIYLGILKMGGIVISIAESFSSQEIATRLQITHTKLVFTQYYMPWANKQLPLYEKVLTVHSGNCIVLPCQKTLTLDLRPQDFLWENFLLEDTHFISVACDPMTPCNILFSSGTTSDPKAIPWNHTTPIKSASDAFFSQNIQAGDVLAWSTSLGWMMGPWLIFAALINKAAIALYGGAIKERVYGEFIQRAEVTMLGVVPTLVAAWRQSKCMENLDWKKIKVFTSTGECSNPSDMKYLMSLAGNKPIIEYCGGTEIGGAYVTSTVIENNYPCLFSTPAMGLNFLILDELGKPANLGEVAIVPPSIGLSTTLLNASHQQVYFANMPKTPTGELLRRHGDQIERLSNGYYCILGRIDDTMNLGGIKISAAEIERAIYGAIPEIYETAAIAAPVDQGPSQLVIYAVTKIDLDKQAAMTVLQKHINQHLNPLFKIHDIVFIRELPKTASNKIMRRTLRAAYQDKSWRESY